MDQSYLRGPFTTRELNSIRQSRVAAEENLQRVEKQIDDFNRKKEDLERQKEDLVKQIERYNAALAPQNWLPLEMLRHIFKFCCESSPGEVHIPPIDNGGVYTISRVSSKWRQVALATPELWSSISLSLASKNEAQIRIAREWLSRAGKVPRSISMTEDLAVEEEYDGWGANVGRNLLVHYPFRTLNLALQAEQLAKLRRLFDQSVPVLEDLSLDCSDIEDAEMSLPFLFRPDDKLTKLRSLTLIGLWDLRNLSVVASWDKMVSLDLRVEIPVAQCLHILRQCTMIDHCRLAVGELATSGLDEASNSPEIILPTLRTLFLHTNNLAAKKLIQVSTAPALKALGIFRQDDSETLNVDTADLRRMVQRSRGMRNLESLYVCTTHTALDSGILLETMPHLHTFDVHSVALSEDVVNLISIGKLGPKLKNIRFSSTHDADQIIGMVEVRHQNASMSQVSDGLQSRISSFTEVAFECMAESTKEEDDIIARKNELEKSIGNLKIVVNFN